MSGGNTTKKQLIERINELTITLQEMKENHVNEINFHRETFEKQKQEMKEHHKNEINIYRELVDSKKNEIYIHEERLKEQNRREKNYKQTIDRLEQTINSLRNQLSENAPPRYD